MTFLQLGIKVDAFIDDEIFNEINFVKAQSSFTQQSIFNSFYDGEIVRKMKNIFP